MVRAKPIPCNFQYFRHIPILKISDKDDRPYIQVKIISENLIGLLDSGASCTVLGNDSKALLDKLNLKPYPAQFSVSVASGRSHEAIGAVDIPYTVNNITYIVPTLIVPEIKRDLILGIDFWKKFKILPQVWLEMIDNDDVLDQIEHPLTDNESEQFLSILRKFPISKNNTLGKTHLLEHIIETGEAKPVKQKHHIWSPFVQEKVMEEINRMISLGVIEPSQSPWNNPLVVVPKSDGRLRICLDSRKLNSVSLPDAYPLQHINRILGRLQSTKVISSVDLKDAFWQISLEQTSRPKTAFTIPGFGHFQFARLPFGLSNSAQSLARLMDKVLGVDLEPKVYVYLDDLVIMSDSIKEHLELLAEVGRRLSAAGLTINLKKSKFLQKQIKYLGYIVDSSGLRADPDKITPVINYPAPTTTKECRRFIGMSSWYRRFIPNFSILSAPISDLVRKGKKFVWTSEANEAFIKLKEALVSPPVLSNPDFSKPFSVQCDASDSAISGVLNQQDDEGNELVISYFSQKLTPTQRKYATTEKEALAVLDSLKKFRGWIEGTHVTVITDHSSLIWLQNIKDPSGRLARWALKLQQYDITLKHRPGRLHVVPDALSRALEEVCEIEVDLTDKWYSKLSADIQSNPQDFPNFKIVADVIYKYCSEKSDLGDYVLRWKQVVPLSLRKEIIRICHDIPSSGHLGIWKSFQRAKSQYYWPNMIGDFKTHISSCEVCKRIKYPTHKNKVPMGAQKVASHPFEIISIDFVGEFTRSKRGNKAIFVVSDWFSKFVFLHPSREMTSKVAIDFLKNHVFNLFGTPRILVCDNAKIFESHNFKNLLKDYNVKLWYNASYHPQVNPTERNNSVIEASVRAYLENDQREWDLHLQEIACAMRTSVHESTKFSPYFVLFGREICRFGSDHNREKALLENENKGFEDVVTERKDLLEKVDNLVKENIAKAYKRYSGYYNLRTRPVSYQVGDIVYRKNFALSNKIKNISAKLTDRNIKCKISRIMGSNTYELVDMNDKRLGVFHVKDFT